METKYSYSPYKERYLIPSIAKVIYNPPATIILWGDKTKTVVKCCENDFYDPEKGLAMAIIKKLCENDSILFHRLLKRCAPENPDALRPVSANYIPATIFGIGSADDFNNALRKILGGL